MSLLWHLTWLDFGDFSFSYLWTDLPDFFFCVFICPFSLQKYKRFSPRPNTFWVMEVNRRSLLEKCKKEVKAGRTSKSTSTSHQVGKIEQNTWSKIISEWPRKHHIKIWGKSTGGLKSYDVGQKWPPKGCFCPTTGPKWWNWAKPLK